VSRPGRSARRFRGDFYESRWVGVRVRRDGFEIDDEIHEQLKGSLRATTRIRKLFEDGMLACRSDDGKRSTEEKLCADCNHPQCRPQLRVQLEQGNQVLILDLPHSSARNLIRLEDELERKGKSLAGFQLVLRVVDQGYWGEVRFETA
jgi:hypothetical protein